MTCCSIDDRSNLVLLDFVGESEAGDEAKVCIERVIVEGTDSSLRGTVLTQQDDIGRGGEESLFRTCQHGERSRTGIRVLHPL